MVTVTASAAYLQYIPPLQLGVLGKGPRDEGTNLQRARSFLQVTAIISSRFGARVWVTEPIYPVLYHGTNLQAKSAITSRQESNKRSSRHDRFCPTRFLKIPGLEDQYYV